MFDEYLRAIYENFVPIHQELFEYSDAMISDETIKWLGTEETDEVGIPLCVQTHSEGLYSFELFKPPYRTMILEEINNIKQFLKDHNIPQLPPNPYNNHGLILGNFFFYDMVQCLVERVIEPIAKKLWWGIGESSLNYHEAFTVAYGKDLDQGIGLHSDDSEVTVNYCLGEEFEGSDLVFAGVRCRGHERVQPYKP